MLANGPHCDSLPGQEGAKDYLYTSMPSIPLHNSAREGTIKIYFRFRFRLRFRFIGEVEKYIEQSVTVFLLLWL